MSFPQVIGLDTYRTKWTRLNRYVFLRPPFPCVSPSRWTRWSVDIYCDPGREVEVSRSWTAPSAVDSPDLCSASRSKDSNMIKYWFKIRRGCHNWRFLALLKTYFNPHRAVKKNAHVALSFRKYFHCAVVNLHCPPYHSYCSISFLSSKICHDLHFWHFSAILVCQFLST